MTETGADGTRREYLRYLVAAGLLPGVAGCPSSSDDSADSTETPINSEAADPTPTATPAPSPTATPDESPQLATATAEAVDAGQALQYHIVAADDNLSYVSVSYGDTGQEWSDPGERVDESGQLTDLGQSEENQVVFLARDSAGQETRERRNPDDTAPTLADYAVHPTESAGDVRVTLQGEDNTGLERLALRLNRQTALQQRITGQQKVTTETTVDISDAATLGEENTLTAMLEDWNRNQTATDSNTYIRKYDVMEDPRLNIGVNYLLWAGDKFGKCMPLEKAEPSIGHYDDPMSPETTTKHIDQMQGHGITNILINFNGTQGDRRSLKQFTDAQLADDIDLRPIYAVKDYRWNPDETARNWKDQVVPSDMNFLRDHILNRENIVTYEGRPVVNIWNAARIPWHEDYHSGVMEEWGDYESFTQDIRSNLRVEGKDDPFLIGGIGGGTAYSGIENSKPQIPDFLRTLDATTSWTAWGPRQDSPAYWEEDVLPWLEQTYEGHREFTDKHDMEFVPMVFPGFNHELNTCWGSGGVIPRDLGGFEQLLELADKYRTTEMVDVATWNDWTEGTQIEPGKYKDDEYGTDYLQAIKEYQTK